MTPSPLSKLVSGLIPGRKAAAAPLWLPTNKPYPRLDKLDAGAEGLSNRSGIYALWHLGVRPQWLRVGAAINLATTLEELATLPAMAAHSGNNGVFAAWAFPPKDQISGMVNFLVERLQPSLQSETCRSDLVIDAAVKAIVCPLPPGTSDIA